MKEFKGTKGEWVVDGNFNLSDNYSKYIRDGKGNILFNVSTLLDGKNNNVKIKESKANAQLIAAAPELLETLQNVLNDDKDGVNITKLSVYTRSKINQAINKALGQ